VNFFETNTFTLRWSLALDPIDPSQQAPPSAKLLYEVEAREEVYLADRLWDYTPSGRRIPDPRGVYRFVHGNSLRLVFWQAPRPKDVQLRVVYTPLFSRVRAGETLRKELTLGLPIEEYSSLARDVDAPSEVVLASQVALVLGYRLRSSMPADPKPPLNESPDAAGYIVRDPWRLVSTADTPPIPVRRRLGDIPRPVLPGDEVAT
jgi:hypothetical protein